jgi:hypothetical protein
VTLKAQNTTESIVEAKASAEAGNTGVGVSVGINVAVDNDTRAAVDGKLTGGSDLTVEADGSHTVNTTVTAGGLSKGGTAWAAQSPSPWPKTAPKLRSAPVTH